MSISAKDLLNCSSRLGYRLGGYYLNDLIFAPVLQFRIIVHNSYILQQHQFYIIQHHITSILHHIISYNHHYTITTFTIATYQ